MYHGLTERSAAERRDRPGFFFSFPGSRFPFGRLFKPSAGCAPPGPFSIPARNVGRAGTGRTDEAGEESPRWQENVENFKQAVHSRTHFPYRTETRNICGRPGRNDPRSVSTRRRLNVAPTTARKITGSAVFVPSVSAMSPCSSVSPPRHRLPPPPNAREISRTRQ